MKLLIHKTAAIIATLCVITFLLSTIISELFFNTEVIAQVKRLIVMPGLIILIPAIALTGATGFSMAQNAKGGLIGKKRKRMPFIGANGVLILVPSAIILNHWASIGQFDMTFYLIQCLEIFAGAINITLMSLNIRDGRKMTGKVRSGA
ncbi:MAG: hypothetical protein OQL19_07120 [Gammaproteobacteria bacterium]|nr:hypothetical protein [Gammaproteobacteria bacterium]